MVDRFYAFMVERHAIYERRKEGKTWPWTTDQVLQTYRFTNVYRELDKTTKWFATNVRGKATDAGLEVFRCLAFRQFNTIRVGQPFNEAGLYDRWDRAKAAAILRRLGPPYVTGAYIINSPNGVPKHVGCLDMIARAWKQRHDLAWAIGEDPTLESAVRVLTGLPHIGGFMAYEVTCDLRHTPVLYDAPDVLTWAHVGPGALRGLKRLEGARNPRARGQKRALGAPRKAETDAAGDPRRRNRGFRGVTLRRPALDTLRALLAEFREAWHGGPPLEMREIEHSLCEWDKYERARRGEGRPRQLLRHGENTE